MSWYYGTFACGHEGRVNVAGKEKDREWKVNNNFSKRCIECYTIEREEIRLAEQMKAAEMAKEMELPELTGSEKQVAWANILRNTLIDKLDKVSEVDLKTGVPDLSFDDLKRIRIYIMENKITAKYFIDNRENTLIDMISLEREQALKSEIEKIIEIEEEEIIKEIMIESTVRPVNPITETKAIVKVVKDIIKVNFSERNERFREVIKGLKLAWNYDSWERKIVGINGAVEDRAAEVGHHLLNEGFIVCIDDMNIRNNAIAGNYEQECTSWVAKRISGKYEGWFVISWDRADDYYNVVKRITGSKYDKPGVVVPPDKFEDVISFAERYGFELTSGAKSVVQEATDTKQRALVVDVPKPIKKPSGAVEERPIKIDVPEEVEIDEEFRDDI